MPVSKTPPLAECVRKSLERYFEDLGGANTQDLHALVIAEVERPLLEKVMAHAKGNQLKAAAVLGINRNTLRKKLEGYGLK